MIHRRLLGDIVCWIRDPIMELLSVPDESELKAGITGRSPRAALFQLLSVPDSGRLKGSEQHLRMIRLLQRKL